MRGDFVSRSNNFVSNSDRELILAKMRASGVWLPGEGHNKFK